MGQIQSRPPHQSAVSWAFSRRAHLAADHLAWRCSLWSWSWPRRWPWHRLRQQRQQRHFRLNPVTSAIAMRARRGGARPPSTAHCAHVQRRHDEIISLLPRRDRHWSFEYACVDQEAIILFDPASNATRTAIGLAELSYESYHYKPAASAALVEYLRLSGENPSTPHARADDGVFLKQDAHLDLAIRRASADELHVPRNFSNCVRQPVSIHRPLGRPIPVLLSSPAHPGVGGSTP